jgi:hypothetical protein
LSAGGCSRPKATRTLLGLLWRPDDLKLDLFFII